MKLKEKAKQLKTDVPRAVLYGMVFVIAKISFRVCLDDTFTAVPGRGRGQLPSSEGEMSSKMTEGYGSVGPANSRWKGRLFVFYAERHLRSFPTLIPDFIPF